jgi:hypothetical protein
VSDFPRGWTLAVDQAIASITVPAIPGVAHVLDSVSAKMNSTNAAVGGALVTLSSSDGTYNNFVLGHLQTAGVAAPGSESDSLSGSDLNLAAGPGASLTIAFSGGGPGIGETLVIQGHDI